MKIAVFSAKPYDRDFLDAANARSRHELSYFETRLTCETAALARGFEAVCCFVNDELDRGVLEEISAAGVRLAVLRCAGFNNVDLEAARDLGMSIGRVPAYSPNAVAEHMFALLLTLIRKTHRAYNRVREGNFSLDGLLGFDLSGKTVGIVGLGAIGSVVAKIAMGFGCRVIAFDPYPREECENAGVRYCPLEDLLARSDIITLHCPLDAGTRHLIDAEALARMKSGAILVNTSRGAVVDTRAVIEALKSDRLGGLAIDVYEEEEELSSRIAPVSPSSMTCSPASSLFRTSSSPVTRASSLAKRSRTSLRRRLRTWTASTVRANRCIPSSRLRDLTRHVGCIRNNT
jgi:D-lactate dehydrogenase